MLDFDAFEVLSFDCYGTLIDWEQGILGALRPIFAMHAVTADEAEILSAYARFEAEVEGGEYQSYRFVLKTVLEKLGEHFGFSPSPAQIGAFVSSQRKWPPFPDAPEALRRLQGKYRIGVVSNIDRDLFVHSQRLLKVSFDWVVTASEVRAYKPSPKMFEAAIERAGVAKEKILHVAQSLYHDIAPAKAFGLTTVWVDRRKGLPGSGATPPAKATPDFEVPDLHALAEAAECA
ncbi:MAG: haloacid dehalogenase type II [Deltaproteobacteria bacterium]|nr:MAG: haloacid dehalogenase type II [Deltaproteobacteria bacterium]